MGQARVGGELEQLEFRLKECELFTGACAEELASDANADKPRASTGLGGGFRAAAAVCLGTHGGISVMRLEDYLAQNHTAEGE